MVIEIFLWCAIAVLGGAGGALLVAGRRERDALRGEIRQRETAAVEKANALKGELAQLAARIEELEQVKPPVLSWGAQATPVNLSRRGQVLRLYRRGSSIPEIASALKLSQGEVKLIIRVHEVSRDPEAQATATNPIIA